MVGKSPASPTKLRPVKQAARFVREPPQSFIECGGSLFSVGFVAMGTLLASVLPLAIGAAISPTILAAQLLLLSNKSDPLKKSAAALVGSGLVLILYTAIPLALGAGSSSSSSPSTVDGIVKLVFAVLLLGLGVRAALGSGSGSKEQKRKPAEGPGLVRSFEFGAVMMLINFTTLALYFPAIHEVAASPESSSDKFVAILIVFLITMIPAYVPLLATIALGEHARRVLAKFNLFLTSHQQGLKVGICFLFAAYLGVSGLKILFQ